MGDGVLCSPALRLLRESMDGSRLTFYGNQVVLDVLGDNPWCDDLLIQGGGGKSASMSSEVRQIRGGGFDGAVLLSNSFRSALLVYRAGIGRRIGYSREGRGGLLTDKISPVRIRERFAPISMVDYYGYLAEKAVGIPRPVAFGEQRNWLGERRSFVWGSFVMMEELPQVDSLERLLANGEEKREDYALLRDKKELIRQTALLVRRLHRAGFCHRDLTLAQLFLSRDRLGGERLNLIDLQRVYRPLIRRRRQVKDLAQLYYSARAYFSGTDIMRFLYEYLGRKKLNSDDKRLLRAVYAKIQYCADSRWNRDGFRDDGNGGLI